MEKVLKIQAVIFFQIMLLLIPAVSLHAKDVTKTPLHILHNVKSAIDSFLNYTDGRLVMSSKKIVFSGLTGKKTEGILLYLCQSVPGSVDCAMVDPEGRIVTVMPDEFKKYEGMDISGEEQFMQFKKTGNPVLGRVSPSVEGMDAVHIHHPVYLKHRKLAGSVRLLLRPDVFLASVIAPSLEGCFHEVWLMQKDGRIVYDKDAGKIGRLLFEDPLFKTNESILAAGRMIAENQKGITFLEVSSAGGHKQIKKTVHWDTVGLYGTEWRLVVVGAVDHEERKQPMPGSDRDAHGCIGSAGYTWCESAQKCLRMWEEPCP